ncbi:M15 family metallopeptidase [Phocoenobacter skyensis]|uniref:LD-carboxypeptidase LdcB, LAS superfamily n=1 Tax=Phocoenobacter skyensis TaxID=97481 RepID=A0A1H7Z5M5_9PAST|nr:M15 family metallopeptidase [Pasteurella skyensis]MDP8171130.1 M15 family metallopeptidase [Pasteurella skyensis]MDP8175210.1 M15 family metallopeptidase [Pasteurella skyensis]MDP8185880.1 M15 family metallopeptidase [Pasteurella skyensis]QLB22944.1 peptidase M15 [Pasteurella skyensis]SEM52767.1 LD-carboxypeptidase LdcB, LAS superfamily [Pasteurella skyensis]
MVNLINLLTGKTHCHLVSLPDSLSSHHLLQKQVMTAYLGLQKHAKKAGFNLQPASTFRDFERQKLIWNAKFNGTRKVHNDSGEKLDLSQMNEWQKCQAILRWSAVAGASRHHWGTEIDVFDPDLLPPNQRLQLEPWEYQAGGYFAEFANFLQDHTATFDFYLPFSPSQKQIGVEPWHMSYRPLSEQYQRQLTPEILKLAWQGEDIAGKNTLIQNIELLFKDYIL